MTENCEDRRKYWSNPDCAKLNKHSGCGTFEDFILVVDPRVDECKSIGNQHGDACNCFDVECSIGASTHGRPTRMAKRRRWMLPMCWVVLPCVWSHYSTWCHSHCGPDTSLSPRNQSPHLIYWAITITTAKKTSLLTRRTLDLRVGVSRQVHTLRTALAFLGRGRGGGEVSDVGVVGDCGLADVQQTSVGHLAVDLHHRDAVARRVRHVLCTKTGQKYCALINLHVHVFF